MVLMLSEECVASLPKLSTLSTYSMLKVDSWCHVLKHLAESSWLQVSCVRAPCSDIIVVDIIIVVVVVACGRVVVARGNTMPSNLTQEPIGYGRSRIVEFGVSRRTALQRCCYFLCRLNVPNVLVLPRLQLVNKGEQGDKNYTQVVPWMESLLFRKPGPEGGDGPPRDTEVMIILLCVPPKSIPVPKHGCRTTGKLKYWPLLLISKIHYIIALHADPSRSCDALLGSR